MSNETFSTGAERDSSNGKPRYDLISPLALDLLARLMEFGARKYAPRNWERGIPIMRSYASLLRHLQAFIMGEWLDPESSLPHLVHALWNVHAMLHTMLLIRSGILDCDLDDRVQDVGYITGEFERWWL